MEKASSNYNSLVQTVSISKIGSVKMGKLLYELKRDESFREAVGDGIETWQSFLAQPEIGLSVSEANRLIQIHETFVIKFSVDEAYLATVPIKNLHYLLPVVKEMDDSTEVGNLVNEAAHLSQRDFKERMHDIRTDDSGVRTYEYIVMKKCVETGGMRKVHEIPSDTIKSTFGLDD